MNIVEIMENAKIEAFKNCNQLEIMLGGEVSSYYDKETKTMIIGKKEQFDKLTIEQKQELINKQITDNDKL